MPAIIRFLGYNPLPPAEGWAERLVQCRTALGITQKESAQRLGVYPSTLARWERGERKPAGEFAVRAERFVADAEVGCTASSVALSASLSRSTSVGAPTEPEYEGGYKGVLGII